MAPILAWLIVSTWKFLWSDHFLDYTKTIARNLAFIFEGLACHNILIQQSKVSLIESGFDAWPWCKSTLSTKSYVVIYFEAYKRTFLDIRLHFSIKELESEIGFYFKLL